MKKSIFLILFFCILSGAAFFMKPEDLAASGKIEVDYPYEAEGAWRYPDKPEVQVWRDMNFDERIAFYSVPQEELDRMTTEALLDTALNYPYNINLDAYDDEKAGFMALLRWNDALAALRERPDRHEVVQARLKSMDALMGEVGALCSSDSLFQHNYLSAFAAYME